MLRPPFVYLNLIIKTNPSIMGYSPTYHTCQKGGEKEITGGSHENRDCRLWERRNGACGTA